MYTTPEQMTAMSERYNDWKQAGYPGGDPLVIQWVQLFEQVPGLVPVFSCEGHVQEVQGSAQSVLFGMYMGWAYDERGADRIHAFYRLLAKEVGDLVPSYWFGDLFRLGCFKHSLNNEFRSGSHWVDFQMYTLHVAAMPPEVGEKIQQAFTRALEQLVALVAAHPNEPIFYG